MRYVNLSMGVTFKLIELWEYGDHIGACFLDVLKYSSSVCNKEDKVYRVCTLNSIVYVEQRG